MSRIYSRSRPKGTAIGIAFSGGLDTRCAVAWMSEQGMAVHAYTADLAQPDEANPADIPPIALQHGAAKARLVDCREAMVREGLVAIQCGAFHLSHRRQEVLQHHAARPRGDHDRDRARDARGRRPRLRRRLARTRATTSSASTATGSSSTRRCSIYKPWLDQAFVTAFGGRKEMSEYLERPASCPTRWATEKAYSTDANVLGATHEAKDLERLDKRHAHRRADHGRRALEARGRRSRAEEVTVAFEQGVPVDAQRQALRLAVRAVPRGEPRSAAATASA